MYAQIISTSPRHSSPFLFSYSSIICLIHQFPLVRDHNIHNFRNRRQEISPNTRQNRGALMPKPPIGAKDECGSIEFDELDSPVIPTLCFPLGSRTWYFGNQRVGYRNAVGKFLNCECSSFLEGRLTKKRFLHLEVEDSPDFLATRGQNALDGLLTQFQSGAWTKNRKLTKRQNKRHRN